MTYAELSIELDNWAGFVATTPLPVGPRRDKLVALGRESAAAIRDMVFCVQLREKRIAALEDILRACLEVMKDDPTMPKSGQFRMEKARALLEAQL